MSVGSNEHGNGCKSTGPASATIPSRVKSVRSTLEDLPHPIFCYRVITLLAHNDRSGAVSLARALRLAPVAEHLIIWSGSGRPVSSIALYPAIQWPVQVNQVHTVYMWSRTVVGQSP